eukprot:TRINITY_DN11466_c2_g2_i4.p1 TRINITY_DN11466_c2_g2~~TRINITY_DN11466_c2_g2_i4.p1  ORF type:complete len:993 (+),score=291.61 TRINITY_DN11466_c2_g2_i4:106-3084(+)
MSDTDRDAEEAKTSPLPPAAVNDPLGVDVDDDFSAQADQSSKTEAAAADRPASQASTRDKSDSNASSLSASSQSSTKRRAGSIINTAKLRDFLRATHVLVNCSYYGFYPMDAPRSLQEVDRIATTIAQRHVEPYAVTLCLPKLFGAGLHVIWDAQGHAACRVPAIIACNTPEHEPSMLAIVMERKVATNSFAFWQRDAISDQQQKDMSQAPGACHLWQFSSEDEAKFTLNVLGQAFERLKEASQGHGMEHPLTFQLSLAIGIQEQDKSNWIFCPTIKGGSVFKARAERDRRIHLTVSQNSGQAMGIEGIKRVGISMMTAWQGFEVGDGYFWLDAISTEQVADKTFHVVAQWPSDLSFPPTAKDAITGVSVCLEMHFSGLRNPLRLPGSFKVRLVKGSERVWLHGKQEEIVQFYDVKLTHSLTKERVPVYKAEEIVQRQPTAKMSTLDRLQRAVRFGMEAKSEDDLIAAVNGDNDDNDDDDDGLDDDLVMVSGRGQVDQSIENRLLEQWGQVLTKWEGTSSRTVKALVKKGVPDTLRRQVWLRLAQCEDSPMESQYPILLKQECTVLDSIKWDLERTFPGHPKFQEKGGEGQTQLMRLNMAYSIFDEEIGYVQGLSFITAVLLLHLPEESAFVLFVQIMQHYGLRELFKAGFENLQVRLYQLSKLTEEQLPELHAHFKELNIEAHMYASQWFLTLFATKFSLPLVYRIFDFFLAEGFNAIFRIALALLKTARKDLLTGDFEEVLSYFRIELPRLFVKEDQARQLIMTASKVKISERKLVKLESEYLLQKAEEARQQDPLEYLERENTELKEGKLALERELDEMSRKLVETQTTFQLKLEAAEDALNKEKQINAGLTSRLSQAQADSVQGSQQLEEENRLVKDLYRTTLTETDAERNRLQTELDGLQSASQQKDRRIAELEEQAKGLEARSAAAEDSSDSVELHRRIQDLELELAEAKLQIVDMNCQLQNVQPAAVETTANRASIKSRFGFSRK